MIFVTAYDQYAIRAFDVHAIDYLLKPFDPKRLAEALEQARQRIARGEGGPAHAIADQLHRPGPLQRILIRDNANVQIVLVRSVDYIEAQDDYVAVHVGAKTHLKEQTLAQLANRLDPTRFIRIHRRYLLQVGRLARIEATGTGSRIAVLADATRLPISRTGYRRLSELLDD